MITSEPGTQNGVIITAGASGIGLAIARTFLDNGDRVAIFDIDQAAIDSAVRDNPDLSGLLVDVRNPDAVGQGVEKVVAAFGSVKTLVNNAGLVGPIGPIETTDADQWANCFDVNIHGAFHMIAAVIPHMKNAGTGAIINISSTSTQTRLPHRSAYVASKWALEGLTLNAARELGENGIRVNAIRPGFMDSPRMTGILAAAAERDGVSVEELRNEALGYISMRTMIQPDEIGQTAAFLASNAARHITGQIIGVCGNVEWEG